MSCGADFHGIHGDDTPPEDMFVDDSPTNLDGDGYPFPLPPDASTDAEIAEWEYPGIGNTSLNNSTLHTHTPGFDASFQTMLDHLILAHPDVVAHPRSLWSLHVANHPEGVL